jgi:hypothetical protein
MMSNAEYAAYAMFESNYYRIERRIDTAPGNWFLLFESNYYRIERYTAEPLLPARVIPSSSVSSRRIIKDFPFSTRDAILCLNSVSISIGKDVDSRRL